MKLAAIIVALVAVSQQRAEQLASRFTYASTQTGVGEHVLVALGVHESGLNASAVSQVGARGLMQLLPKAWGVHRDEGEHILVAARVLLHYRQRCGTTLRAVTAYRRGWCGEGPRALATMRLARAIRARLMSQTAAPMPRIGLPR